MANYPLGSCIGYGATPALMAELLPLDLGGLQRPKATTPRPIEPPPVAAQVSTAPPRRNWLVVVLVAVVVFLLVMQFGKGLVPDVDPSPNVDIAGNYVLILVDESKRDQLSAEQAPVINSAKVATWCDDHNVKYRRLDPRDDDALIEDVWKQLKRVAVDPPSLTTLSDGKVKTQPVPAGIEATLTELGKVFK